MHTHDWLEYAIIYSDADLVSSTFFKENFLIRRDDQNLMSFLEWQSDASAQGDVLQLHFYCPKEGIFKTRSLIFINPTFKNLLIKYRVSIIAKANIAN